MDANTHELTISFEDMDPADAARSAQELEQDLREAAPAAKISLVKSREDSQDFGTTLVLVFGTPVAITLAKAVHTFLNRKYGVTITISENGGVVASHLDSKDAAEIAKAFGRRVG